MRVPRWSSVARLFRRPRPTILLYHRIAYAERDIWDLAVSPRRFDMQLQQLKRHRQVLPLSEFAGLHRLGRLPRKAVAITFDDGYACNEEQAAPILANHGLPATFFLTGGWIDSEREFWSDQLEWLVFHPSAEGKVKLTIGSSQIVADLGPALIDPDTKWRAYRDPPRSNRQLAYVSLWRTLKFVAAPEQQCVLGELAQRFGLEGEHVRPAYRPLTLPEARRLAGRPLVEIGAHSMTHPSLPANTFDFQLNEVELSIERCQAIAGRPITSFAYPYGDHSAQTIECLRVAGLEIAVTTAGRAIQSNDRSLALPRVVVTQAHSLDRGFLLA